MKKKQLLFLLIAYALSVTQIFAQDDADETPKKYRWEVNVNANHLLFPSYRVDYYPVHYFVRMKKQNENAWRFSIIPQLNSTTILSSENPTFFGINVGIGHEWAKVKNNLRLYWGTGSNIYYESATGFSGNAASQQPSIPVSTNPPSIKSKSYLFSLQGFIGAQYLLSKKISVSLESKSILYYRDVSINDLNGQNIIFLKYFDWQQFPIGGLFISYQF